MLSYYECMPIKSLKLFRILIIKPAIQSHRLMAPFSLQDIFGKYARNLTHFNCGASSIHRTVNERQRLDRVVRPTFWLEMTCRKKKPQPKHTQKMRNTFHNKCVYGWAVNRCWHFLSVPSIALWLAIDSIACTTHTFLIAWKCMHEHRHRQIGVFAHTLIACKWDGILVRSQFM